MLLSAYFDPRESEEVKAGLLAWFCDELEDWQHEQVVWALRQWNRENPRHRPTPADISAILKRARGEKLARQMQAAAQAQPRPAGMSREQHEQVTAEMADKLAAFIRPIEPPMDKASKAKVDAMIRDLNAEGASE